MAETLTVDTTPDTETLGEALTSDEQESLEIGEKMVAEQELLLAGKYKNAEDLEKAYIELRNKLGKPKEEEEATEEPEAEKEETKETDSDFLNRLWDESQTEFTDETMKELSSMDPKDLANMHLEYRSKTQQPQISDQQVKQLKDVAGGEKDYSAMMDWAKQSLQKKEIDMFDAVMDKGDPTACFFAIQALKYRYDDASGVEGEMLTGKAPSNTGDQFESNAQLIEAMNDPKYDNDPAYRKEVMKKLERSNLEF